jgi:hypothetical protein
MKKIMIVCLLLACTTSFAQNTDVSNLPPRVKGAFMQFFHPVPVSDAMWQTDAQGNYVAAFKSGDREQSAVFNANGHLMETDTRINVKRTPANAISYISANYNGEKVNKLAMIKMPNGENNFKVVINSADLVFDGKGEFIMAIKR